MAQNWGDQDVLATAAATEIETTGFDLSSRLCEDATVLDPVVQNEQISSSDVGQEAD